MKIKDSLDLGGNLLQNFCIDNYSDIDNANRGKGRTIFYTGSDVERKDHVIVFDGTSFKALAYMEDVADNAEFVALKNKVNAFLEGEVDSDNVLENLKEIQAFLDNYSSAKDLSEILDTKLDKTGGTIDSTSDFPLIINTTATNNRLRFRTNGADKSLFGYATDVGTYMYDYGSKKHIGIKDGVAYFGDNEILTSAGGTLTGLLLLQYTNPRIAFKSDANTTLGAVGFKDGVLSANITADNKWYTLLHSGNIAEKATDLNSASAWRFFYNSFSATNKPTGISSSMAGITLRTNDDDKYKVQLGFDNSCNAYLRNQDNGTWSAWKQIAFTDSTVDAANRLISTDNLSLVRLDSDKLYVGNGTYSNYPLHLMGKEIRLRYMSGGVGLMLTHQGNVLINSADDDNSGAKLQVNGDVALPNWGYLKTFKSDKTTAVNLIGVSNDDKLYINSEGSGVHNVILGGNVLLGRTSNDGSKLQVNGSITITNNSYIYSELPDTNKTKVNIFGLNANKMLLVGYDIKTTGATRIYGTSVEFAPNGTATKMLINSSGNVGIGVANPQYKLDVDGHIRTTGTAFLNAGVRLNNAAYISSYIKDDNGSTTTTAKSIMGVNASNSLLIGYGLQTTGQTGIYGKEIYFAPNGETVRMRINESGNVTLGVTDLAGSTYKLVADGNIKAKEKIVFSPADKYVGELSMSTSCLQLSAIQEGVAYLPIALNPNGGNVLIGKTTDDETGAKLQVKGNVSLANIIRKTSNLTRIALEATGDALVYGDDQAQTTFRGSEIAFQCKTGGARSMTMIWNDGDPRVGIGTNTPTEKLHIVGNLHVTGNIIADGEVSAGGAAEEGGSSSGGGGGAFYSTTIATQTTSKAIAHNLETEDIVVSIYEKNGTSGKWEMILTDVEIVDANNITVSFGSATNVEHKVVIMGAVA